MVEVVRAASAARLNCSYASLHTIATTKRSFVLFIDCFRHFKDVHAKWDKISEQEADAFKSTSDLTSQVQTKYSLSADQAKSRVDAWANGRSF